MFDNTRKKELQDLTALAIRRHERVEAKLAAREGGPAPGDLYVFPLPDDVGLQWAVILSHPDNEQLLYTVPADDHPFAGTADVRIPPDTDCGPLALRCGFGLWLHVEQFNRQQRSGEIPEDSIRRARQILSRMLSADFEATAIQDETDFDPEYESWTREVSAAVESLRSSVAKSETPADVVPLDTFQTQWPQRLLDKLDVGTEFALAAAPSGLLGKVYDELKEPSSQPPAYHLIECELPGDLIACREADGIALIYVPKSDEQPPSVRGISESDEWQLLKWTHSPNGKLYRAFPTLLWRNDQVEVSITEGDRVTISRNV